MTHSTVSTPLQGLEQKIVAAFADIEAWLRNEYKRTPPPFYCSTDLRNNGHKIAPVDTNLFPGGFNNLSPTDYPLAAEAIRHQIDVLCPNVQSLLLIPENHSRNLPYLDNVAVLKQLLEMAGVHVRLGYITDEAQPLTRTTAHGVTLTIHQVKKDNGRLHCDDFYPCAVLLNNDLSGGLHPLLQDVEIPILPPPQMGWTTRKKSQHFAHYEKITREFADILKSDPWLLSADFHVCPKVDFQKREGLECLAAAIDETLAQIKEKYSQHHINNTPYVVLKTNAGTYGMGVMMVKAAESVFNLNRKQRNKMMVGKEGIKVQDILIQEGITTIDAFDANPAEPVVYMMGGAAIGGFYRINATRSQDDNLNSSGMSFSPLPFETNCAPPAQKPNDNTAARLYVYGVIGRLANLAAAREIAHLGSL